MQYRVELSRGFWLAVYPVTQVQWQWAMGSNPSGFKGENRPVEMVSWDACQTFCQRLEEKTGQRFCLPAEAEWEYACRAGTTTLFFFGQTVSTEQVNYKGRYSYGGGAKGVSRQQTTPVGSFPANAWGLFDFHGNIWEWRRDSYAPYPKGVYRHQASQEPQQDRQKRPVLRGGCYNNDPVWCRSALRHRGVPSYSFQCGCRLVCLD